jgi:hypothetical protein
MWGLTATPVASPALRVPFEVDDAQVRIKGSKDVLERAILAGRAETETSSQMSTKWRAIQNKTANSYLIEITI